MTEVSPQVSVIIPCFNAGDYVRECVDSAVVQTSEAVTLEILVIDDHSDEQATLAALSDIQASGIARVIKNTGSCGPGAARNLGIQQARGEWVAFMDADDVFAPNGIGKRLATAQLFPDVAWVGGDVAQCDHVGSVTDASYFQHRDITLRYLRNAFATHRPIRFDDTLTVFFDTPLVNTTSSIIRTSELRKINGFDERLKLQQDLHLFLRLACRLAFVFVPTVVAVNRQHNNNSTRCYPRTLRWRHAALSLLAKDNDFQATEKLRAKLKQVSMELSYEYQRDADYLRAAKWRIYGALGLCSSIPAD